MTSKKARARAKTARAKENAVAKETATGTGAAGAGNADADGAGGMGTPGAGGADGVDTPGASGVSGASTPARMKLGVVGLGHMGSALARGAVAAGALDPREIAVLAHSDATAAACKAAGYTLVAAPDTLAGSCDAVLLAVAPKDAPAALASFAACPPRVLFSVVAGLSIAKIRSILPGVPVVRAMPNAALEVGLGATVLAASPDCPAWARSFAKGLFGSAGVVREMDEELLDASVAVHGSTPAYLYYFVECMLDDLAGRGFAHADARALLVQTLAGAAKLLEAAPDKPLSEFVAQVATPGGTTRAAIDVLEGSAFAEGLAAANAACIARCKELAG